MTQPSTPAAAPPSGPPAEGPWCVPLAMTLHAQDWLADWFAAAASGHHQPDMREFNAAVTALRRLLDVRKLLLQWEARPDDDPTQEASILSDDEFRDTLQWLATHARKEGAA